MFSFWAFARTGIVIFSLLIVVNLVVVVTFLYNVQKIAIVGTGRIGDMQQSSVVQDLLYIIALSSRFSTVDISISQLVCGLESAKATGMR